MATTIHIPPRLLTAVDRRARRMRVSRNRLIVRALEREVESDTEWSPGFFEALAPLSKSDAAGVDEMLEAIRTRRRSRRRPPL